MAAKLIDVKQAEHDVQVADALLVCAYDSDTKFASNRLRGAISLNEFRSQAESLSKQREVIFYCA
jgi:hypothetical protein